VCSRSPAADGRAIGAPVLVAPDSFKGTFSAAQVAEALEHGLKGAGCKVDCCPVADGGEGTLSAMVAATGGSTVCADAHDPLGRSITGVFGLLDQGRTALVESATASGYALLEPHERDPWRATTLGTGELIAAALDFGAELVLVAAGGSATVDGGSGALRALARHADKPMRRLVVLCDVDTPWERCAEIYGPQKGADAQMVRRLEERLEVQAGRLPRDPRGVPRTGAAGGLSGALWSMYDARLEPGAAVVLDTVAFDERLQKAVAVICGEGCVDSQSTDGKVISEITRRAAQRGVPVHAVAGRCELSDGEHRKLGIATVTEAPTLAALRLAGERLAALVAAS
jgi:glycerate kinase